MEDAWEKVISYWVEAYGCKRQRSQDGRRECIHSTVGEVMIIMDGLKRMLISS